MAVSLGLAAVSDLADHPGATLALLALGFLAWAVGVGYLERRQERAEGGDGRGGARGLGAGLLLAALLLRLPLLTLPPTLSDDALRYLWDGRVAAAGANPYALAPEAPELAPLRDRLWQRLPHRSVPTVYPPLALGAFSIAAASPAPLLVWKSIVTAADLAACALLLSLARRRGLPLARAAWYGWNPLVALEVAGMGHVDGLAMAPLVAAVLWLTPRPESRSVAADEETGAGEGGAAVAEPEPAEGGPGGRGARRWRLSAGAVSAAAGAAAAGVLVKLGPLAALPLWARRSGRPGRFLGVALGVAAAGLLPVAVATGGVPPGLLAYGLSWEFNGPLYEPLWRLLDGLGAAPAAAGLVDSAKAATGWHDALNRVYPFLYPQFLAKLLLAIGALGVVVRSVADSRHGLVTACRRLFGGLLLCSATVYPWYLLWVLPFAALDRHRPWLLASALAPLVYAAQVSLVPGGEPLPLFPWIWLAAWGPPALLAAVEAWRRRRPAPAAVEVPAP